MPNPADLIQNLEQDADPEPGASGLFDTQDAEAKSAEASHHNTFIQQSLEGLDLPSIDMTGAEHHEGFNSLFEQSAAAAAEAGPSGTSYHDDDRSLERGRQHGDEDRLRDLSEQQEQGRTDDGAVDEHGVSAGTGQEPYLMTLANAAEVASDVPQYDDGVPMVARKRRVRSSAGGSGLEQDSVWVNTWQELKEDLRDVGDISDQAGGNLVGELLDVFYKKAEAFLYTRSLNRLHATLVSGCRPSKCLVFAILGTVAVSRVAGLSSEVQSLSRRLGLQLLNLAQKDFLTSLNQPEKVIDAVQAAILVAHVYYTQGKVTEGWLLVTQALRLAVMVGLHHLRIDCTEEQVLEQIHVMDQDVPQIISTTHRRPVPVSSIIPRPSVLPAAEDSAELGERIHLFWTCLLSERIGCMALGCMSSLTDSDILTPWPRPIQEYADGSFIKHNEESLELFWEGTTRREWMDEEDRPKEMWLTSSLKALSLLQAAQK